MRRYIQFDVCTKIKKLSCRSIILIPQFHFDPYSFTRWSMDKSVTTSFNAVISIEQCRMIWVTRYLIWSIKYFYRKFPSLDIYLQNYKKGLGILDSTIAGVAVKKRGPLITKIEANPMSYFDCAKCKSTLRNIETFRRADGNVLHLLTCRECNYRWKEVWLREINP